MTPRYTAIINEIEDFYLNDPRPFVVGYSGGKDSSVTLDLVLRAVMRTKNPSKPVYVSFSDTLIEMDNKIKAIDGFLDGIRNFAKDNNLPVIVEKVQPIVEESFFTLLVGKGYPIPRRDNRWCTDRLKLRPQKRYRDTLKKKHSEGFLNIVGTRKAESTDRRDRIVRNTIDGMLKVDMADSKSNVLMPIEDLTEVEVWDYVLTHSLDWLDSKALVEVYEEGSLLSECKPINEGLFTDVKAEEEYHPECSQNRDGCQFCTLFDKDKTLHSLASKYDYMKDIEEFRNWLVSYREGNWETRDLYNHRNQQKFIYNKKNHRLGMVNVGGYSLEFRKEIARRMIELDTKVFPHRGVHLFSDEELALAQKIWVEEGDFDLTLDSYLREYQRRRIAVSEETRKLIKLAQISKAAFEMNSHALHPEKRILSYFNGKTDERFFAQFAKQLMGKFDEPAPRAEAYLRAVALSEKSSVSPVEAVRFLIKLPLYTRHHLPEGGEEEALKLFTELSAFTKQYFPTTEIERAAREEHKEDRLFLHNIAKLYRDGKIEKPRKGLFGYEGDYGKFFDSLEDENYAVDEDPDLSLEEQIAFFEDWRDQKNEDRATNYRRSIVSGEAAMLKASGF